MPVPKRKTSKSRRDQRSASKFLRTQIFVVCSQCNVPIMPHIVCSVCGYYKGRKIFATKLDRTLKRGEQRRVAAERQAQKAPEQTPAAEESQQAE